MISVTWVRKIKEMVSLFVSLHATYFIPRITTAMMLTASEATRPYNRTAWGFPDADTGRKLDTFKNN